MVRVVQPGASLAKKPPAVVKQNRAENGLETLLSAPTYLNQDYGIR
eukprot:COSAG01_NODE_9988_length_2281_cov_41.068744_4_plen_46_part_00